MKNFLKIPFMFAISVAFVYAQDDATLIDVTNLDQLDAMRYDLDGDGLPSSSGEAAWESAFGDDVTADTDDATHSGSNIVGYELTADLDFNGTKWGSDCSSNCLEAAGTEGGTEASVGWLPIGDNTDRFLGTFDGNGHTISNIFIDRDIDAVGLFGAIGDDGEVRNLGIEGGSVKGQNTGPLAGIVRGTARVCYATANAEGESTSNFRVGGLIGTLDGGTLASCYATGNATAMTTNNVDADCGGLVGFSTSNTNISAISNCYATGSATSSGRTPTAGGLIGNASHGSVTACYARGDANATATNSASPGGLVGDILSATITASYFDSDVSNRPSTDEGAQSTAALQGTLSYTGIYEAWDDQAQWTTGGAQQSIWSFCGTNQYPKLNVDFDGDGIPSVAEFGTQGPCTASLASTLDLEATKTALQTSQTEQGTKITELTTTQADQGTKLTDLETNLQTLQTTIGTSTTPTAEATYTVTFTSTWSSTTHPINFPTNSNPHYSSLIGAVHNSSFNMWEVGATVGQNAAMGMEQMAETGGTSQLRTFIENAITATTAKAIISGAGLGQSTGSTSINFTATQEHPQITLVSMIAPSPDWFIGVQNLNLFENNAWVETKTIDLRLYDAGTDDGETYTAPNADTNPKEPISRLTSPNNETSFMNGEPFIGTFTFSLTSAPTTGATTSTGLSGRITTLETTQTAQDTKITTLETSQTAQDTKITTLETAGTAQDTKITELETAGTAQDTKITELETAKTALETGQAAQDTKITTLETTQTTHGTKLTTIEAKIAAFEAALTNAGVEIPDPPPTGGTPGGGTPGGGTPGTTPPTGGTPGTTPPTGTPPTTTTIYSVPATSGAPQAYPNPAKQKLLFANLTPGNTYVYKIYTAAGNFLTSGTVQDDKAINISALESGQYLLTLQNNDREVLRTSLLVE